MCTYVTHNLPALGSAKGRDGWFPLSRATVYFDHPFHAPLEHSLNIDFADTADPSKRVAVELSPATARALAEAILAALETGETMLGKMEADQASALLPTQATPPDDGNPSAAPPTLQTGSAVS